jgi:hypothetical protein
MSGILADNVGRSSGLMKAVAAAGGAWTYILTRTYSSGDSQADIEFVHGTDGVVLDSTYDTYAFLLSSVAPSGDGETLQAQLKNASGWVTSSNYKYFVLHGASSASSVSVNNNTGNSQWNIANNTGSNAGEGWGGFLFLHSAVSSTMFTGASWTGVGTSSSTNAEMIHGGGIYSSAETHVGLRFDASNSSNMEGRITMYGIKHS